MSGNKLISKIDYKVHSDFYEFLLVISIQTCFMFFFVGNSMSTVPISTVRLASILPKGIILEKLVELMIRGEIFLNQTKNPSIGSLSCLCLAQDLVQYVHPSPKHWYQCHNMTC